MSRNDEKLGQFDRRILTFTYMIRSRSWNGTGIEELVPPIPTRPRLSSQSIFTGIQNYIQYDRYWFRDIQDDRLAPVSTMIPLNRDVSATTRSPRITSISFQFSTERVTCINEVSERYTSFFCRSIGLHPMISSWPHQNQNLSHCLNFYLLRRMPLTLVQSLRKSLAVKNKVGLSFLICFSAARISSEVWWSLDLWSFLETQQPFTDAN